MSLRVSRTDGSVTLTLPRGTPLREGLAFAQDREVWLRRTLSEIRSSLVAPPVLTFGTAIPFRGALVTLLPAQVRRPLIDGTALLLPRGEDQIGARLQAFLKATARDALATSADRHAARLGRTYGRLTLRDTRGRWGSCTSRGDLMFSWRLIMAPDQVLDYVAAHEVAHLVQMNHSPDFWAVVERLYPDHAAARDWLRANGSALHAFRFTD
jgi:predicted metal-dependent hydrolase